MIEYKKHLLELPKEEIIERYLQVCENIEILDASNKRLRKQLTLTDVGCSFSIGFAQYIAEEHYRLVNVENGKYYWKNETHLKTSQELLLDYKELID